MKDQTNLIVSIVAIVFAIGFVLAFYFTARKPMVAPPVTPVPLTKVVPAEGAVVMANSLPGAGSGGAGGGGGAGGRGGGSRKGGPSTGMGRG